METKKPDSSRIPKSGRIKFYIFNCLLDRGHSNRPVSLRVMKNINSVVAKMDSLVPGELRNGSGFVATLRGDFVPPDVDEQAE